MTSFIKGVFFLLYADIPSGSSFSREERTVTDLTADERSESTSSVLFVSWFRSCVISILVRSQLLN